MYRVQRDKAYIHYRHLRYIQGFHFRRLYMSHFPSIHTDTLTMALIDLKENMGTTQMQQMQEWLKTRTNAKKIKFVIE